MSSGRYYIELGKYTSCVRPCWARLQSLEAGILLCIYHEAISCLNQVHYMILYHVYMASSSSSNQCDLHARGVLTHKAPVWGGLQYLRIQEHGRLTTEVSRVYEADLPKIAHSSCSRRQKESEDIMAREINFGQRLASFDKKRAEAEARTLELDECQDCGDGN